ncbi:polyprenyl synthetase family protein [Nitrincola alkalisediminis]|nr:farnesyl diphosphate synthase [Nitrincola alkalisediminis]
MDLSAQLKHYTALTEEHLNAQIPAQVELYPYLQNAMRYSLLQGGKRIRPALVFLANAFCGADDEKALAPAAAIEMIHTYSLIHDDLPAMDNDELRRGKPTCHIEFGEANAILAGDALLTLAFEVLSRPSPLYTPESQLKMIQTLAVAAGHRGMVAGQAFDLAHEDHPLTLDQLEAMHCHKTGALISASLTLGAQAADCQDQQVLQDLSRFGRIIGLAFQVKDDLLDIEGDTLTLGKPSGSDLARNKPTYPALLGLQGAKDKLLSLQAQAHTCLHSYGSSSSALLALADYIVERDH